IQKGTTSSRFVLVENALNYQDESGQWRESRDLVEPCPEGAIARHGPHRAFFRSDLNSKTVFEITDSDGHKIAGAFREIRLSCGSHSRVIARVKIAAVGIILSPNLIVWEDCMDGLNADLVILWRHNLFAQYLVHKGSPSLPPDFDPSLSRL